MLFLTFIYLFLKVLRFIWIIEHFYIIYQWNRFIEIWKIWIIVCCLRLSYENRAIYTFIIDICNKVYWVKYILSSFPMFQIVGICNILKKYELMILIYSEAFNLFHAGKIFKPIITIYSICWMKHLHWNLYRQFFLFGPLFLKKGWRMKRWIKPSKNSFFVSF